MQNPLLLLASQAYTRVKISKFKYNARVLQMLPMKTKQVHARPKRRKMPNFT